MNAVAAADLRRAGELLDRKRRNPEKLFNNSLRCCGERTCGEETASPMERSDGGVSRGCGRQKSFVDKELRNAATGGRCRPRWRGASNNCEKRLRRTWACWRKPLHHNRFRRRIRMPRMAIVGAGRCEVGKKSVISIGAPAHFGCTARRCWAVAAFSQKRQISAPSQQYVQSFSFGKPIAETRSSSFWYFSEVSPRRCRIRSTMAA